MKNKTAQQIKVGLFVCLALLFSMVAIFLLSGTSNFFEKDYALYVRFTDSNGLRSGSGVFLAGIGIGTVEEIKFPPSLEEKEVIVKLKINRKYRERIREDSFAMVSTQGLLGDKMVVIQVGSPQLPELKENSFLKTKKTFSLENVTERGEKLLDNLNDLTANLNGTLKDLREKPGLVNTLIYDERGKEIIADLLAISGTARRVVGKIERGNGLLHTLIYDKEGRELTRNLIATSKNLKETSGNFKSVSQKIQRGEGSLGALLADPGVYNDLRALLGGANRSKLVQAVIRHLISKNEKDTLK